VSTAAGPGRARIAVVGDAGLDVLAATAALPGPGGDARATIEIRPGGAGANTAAWLASLGADPVLIARVGTDLAAAQVRAALAAAGVTTALAADPVAPTCTVVVLVDGTGQRTMLADRGAAARLAPADVALPAGTRHLHLSGYVLLDDSSRPAGLAALAGARRSGLTTSVDPQAAELLTDPAGFLELVHGIDLLLPSAGELAALGGTRAVLAAVGAVAVTDGPRGAAWVDRTARLEVSTRPAEVVDTTGAGDAFDAGVLAAWTAGAAPRDALAAGVAAGTRAVRRPGAWP
jgi:sugar/nucleoside kinase (ribokinase family)